MNPKGKENEAGGIPQPWLGGRPSEGRQRSRDLNDKTGPPPRVLSTYENELRWEKGDGRQTGGK